MDIGKQRSEKMLKDLEKKISVEYSKAAKETEAKLNKHLDQFAQKDVHKRRQLERGAITVKEYNNWRTGQLVIGERWEVLTKELSEIASEADKVSAELMKEHCTNVYATNRNFAEYSIDMAIGNHVTKWVLYDNAVVKRLLLKNPKLLPDPSERVMANVAAGRAQLWERRQIQSVMLQGIMQGESITNIAKRSRKELGESWFVEDIKNKNKKTAKQIAKELERKNRSTAIRNARTMTTSAENAGRMDCYKQAESIGISLQKTWLSTADSRTRRSHAEIDGETVPINEEFSNGLMYPADLEGSPEEVYNCRCTLIAEVNPDESNVETGQSVDGMSFDDWEEMMQ